MLNISQVILVRTDSNLCRKEFTVHMSAPNSLIKSYLQPCTNSVWGDESEAVAPIIWLIYRTVDARKEEVLFPDLLITLRRHVFRRTPVDFPGSRPGTRPTSIVQWCHDITLAQHVSKMSKLLKLRPTNAGDIVLTFSRGNWCIQMFHWTRLFSHTLLL